MANTISPATINESLLYAVKRIEGVKNGTVITYGTGWVLTLPFPGQGKELSMLVTNRHVIEGVDAVRILFHTKSGNMPDGGTTFLTVERNAIFSEPSGPDVAIILFGHVVNDWSDQNPGRGLYFVSMREGHVVTEEAEKEFDVCEPILMVGCPNGLWDEANGFPLFRRGVTATHPAIDFNGNREFAIDVGVYSGSSGSPVFLWESGLIKESKAKLDYSPGLRFWLLGMLWGGPRISEAGRLAIEPVPTDSRLNVTTGVRMHLGYVIKAQEILQIARKLHAQIAQATSA